MLLNTPQCAGQPRTESDRALLSAVPGGRDPGYGYLGVSLHFRIPKDFFTLLVLISNFTRV